MIAYFTTLMAAVASVNAAPQQPVRKPARVSEIRIDKSEHRLDLMVGNQIYKRYRVAIGPGGLGPKQFEWDFKTPIGTYKVISHMGIFHKFLHLNYPNAQDLARYARLRRAGKVPPGRTAGDSIGIHGTGSPAFDKVHKQSDWTAGCVALDNAEIDEIAKLAPVGTKVVISE